MGLNFEMSLLASNLSTVLARDCKLVRFQFV
jgi:hypothetical protein